MGNVFPTDVRLHRKYDIKGSTYGRTAGSKIADPNAILKVRDAVILQRLLLAAGGCRYLTVPSLHLAWQPAASSAHASHALCTMRCQDVLCQLPEARCHQSQPACCPMLPLAGAGCQPSLEGP